MGEAIARLSAAWGADWCEAMVLADYSVERARAVADRIGQAERFTAVQIDAREASEIAEAARAHECDLVMNAVDPQFVMPIFRGALEAGAHYMDMAMSLSRPHPDRPLDEPGVKLGDEQFALEGEWESRGKLALVGAGMDPGLSDVFAAHAAKHLLDEVHEVHVRDGGDLATTPTWPCWTDTGSTTRPSTRSLARIGPPEGAGGQLGLRRLGSGARWRRRSGP